MPIETPLQHFVQSVRHGLWLVAAISFITNVMMLALPLYSLQIFDRVLLSHSMDTLWVLTLGVCIAMTSVALLENLRGQLLLRLSNRLALSLEQRIFDETLLRASRIGDHSLQAMRDLGMLRNFISAPQGLVALIDAPWVPIYIIVVYFMHPWLGHVMVIGAVLLITVALATEKFVMPITKVGLNAIQQAQNRLDGLIKGSSVVVAHGMNHQAFDYWQILQHDALATTSRASVHGGQFASIAKGARLFLNIALTGIGAYLVIHNEISMGAMIAANIMTSRALAPMELLIGASRQLIGVNMAYQRLEEMLKKNTPPPSIRLPSPRGEIELERVIFMPPGSDQPTIKGISLKLEPGTFLALIGPSAAGKSTLAQLLCGVWLPKSGVIRLDGADVNAWNREDFGRNCGYLPQDVQLMNGTVRQNICRFTDADDEAIVAAAQAASAHELIVRLPKGYDTEVGQAGTALSAGQRQRIGLARALFGDPKLIVLDEPNANLDTDGEIALAESLAKAKARGATLVVISHRPSLLGLADMIAVLVDGQLQQFGPRQEIMKKLQPHAVTNDRNAA